MTGGVEADDLLVANVEALFVFCQLDVNRNRGEGEAIPGGPGHPFICLFHGPAVELVHDEPTPQGLAKS